MPVAGHDDVCTSTESDAREVVVVRVAGHAPDHVLWQFFGDLRRTVVDAKHVADGLGFGQVPAEVGAREHFLELKEHLRGDDQLEFAPFPTVKQLTRRTTAGDRRGDQDVRIEDGPQGA